MFEQAPAPSPVLDALAGTLVLGALLDELRTRFGTFELLDHWTQGEFHHDLVVRVRASDVEDEVDDALPGDVLVVATNCNGGVKEVLCFAEPPTRASLWAMRCPGNPDFAVAPARPTARSCTLHWFDPCELLVADARSELRPEHRERQSGGGWVPRVSDTPDTPEGSGVSSRGCATRSVAKSDASRADHARRRDGT